jgi:hypothetical protein
MLVLICIGVAIAIYLLIRRPRWLTQFFQLASQLQVGDVVQIPNLPKRPTQLPLGDLGFLREINGPRARVRFFDLTPGGELDYTSVWRDLHELRRPNQATIRESDRLNLQAAEEIAPLLKKRWELDLDDKNAGPEIKDLKNHRRRVRELLGWVKTSELHAEYESEYRCLLAEIDTYWNQAAELRQDYMNLVKAIIISNELIEHNRSLPQHNVSIDEEGERLESAVRQLKISIGEIALNHVLQS